MKDKIKKEKKIKLVSAKKLPKLFKKRYTEAKLNKKVLNLISVPQDRELVQSLFKPDPKKPVYLTADKSLQFEKKQITKLKKIAKDIIAIKPAFKLVPFAAVVIFIAALSVSIFLFKDILLKKAIISGMQSIFESKTEVGYVHVEFFNGKLQIKNLKQTDSSNYMKNMFEIGNVTFDYNLTELLKSKIDIQNVQIQDIAFGTNRKTSGKIYIKKKVKKEKKKKEKQSSSFADNKMAQDLLKKSQNSLTSIFEDYNPETIINSLQDSLQSPVVAQEAQDLVQNLIEKWQKEPEEVQKYVNEVTDIVNTVNKIDWKKLNDPIKIKALIETVDNSIKTANSIVDKTNSIAQNLQNDSRAVQELSKDITAAISNDKKVINTELSKFTQFKDKGLKNTFNDLILAFVYSMMDQYSPKIHVYLEKALELKEEYYDPYSSKKAAKPKKRKKEIKRCNTCSWTLYLLQRR